VQIWKQAIPWGIALVGIVIAASIALWDAPPTVALPITKFSITAEPTANVSGNELAVSPDGSSIVFLSESGTGRQLYLRRRDEITATPIQDTVGSYGSPFFSTDGESVLFFTATQLKRISLLGGGAVSVCDTVLGGVSASSNDDMIVFSDGTFSLYRVSVNGGEPQILASPDTEKGEDYYRHPWILPDGKAVLFTVWGNGVFQTRVLSLETGDQKVVVEGGRQAHYLPTGHLVYERAGTLMAVSFDLDKLEISGRAVSVLEGIRQQNFAADYAISTNGTLVHIPGTRVQDTLLWVDRQGTQQPLMESDEIIRNPRLSPDGKRVAFRRMGGGTVLGDRADIWIYDLDRGTSTPLTFDDLSSSPTWTLDGKQITFGRREGIFNIPADGSGEASQLTTTKANRSLNTPGSWSPDGVLVYSGGVPGNRDIFVLSPEGSGNIESFVATDFYEREPAFSPDGRWIAFVSNRSGRDEVYVKPYPGEGGIIPISTGGGRQPLWTRSGRELFYRSEQKLMVVSVESQPTFKAGIPRLLFEGLYTAAFMESSLNYDISPDGQRFLMVTDVEEDTGLTQSHVTLNWFEELKRLVPIDN